MADSISTITIPKPQIVSVVIHVKGLSPLICHSWSHKAKQEMLDKQMKKATKAKEAKDPERDYEESLYRLEDGRCGFPSVGFKAWCGSARRGEV